MFFCQIGQDRTRFEDPDTGVMIDQRRDPVVWRNGQKTGQELIALTDIDRYDLIWHIQRFQHQRDFFPVWRWRIEQCVHTVPLLSYK